MPNNDRDQQQGAANPAGAVMLPQSEMSRLVAFRGNSKDTVTTEAWAEMVDRHITVLKWTPAQTAGAAIEAFRDDANIWRENMANSKDEDKRDCLGDWRQMRVAFMKRFGKVKTRAAKIQGLGQLKQGGTEPISTFQDKVVHTLDKLTAATMKNLQDGAERRGFVQCRDLFEAAIFLNGMKPNLRLYVDMELTDTSTSDEIYELAKRTEIAVNPTGVQHKVATLDAGQTKQLEQLKAELDEVKRSLAGGPTETVAAFSKGKPAAAPPKKPPPKFKPMAERMRAVLCHKCRQWGLHFANECNLTNDEIKALTPQTTSDRPNGAVHDAQFPNA